MGGKRTRKSAAVIAALLTEPTHAAAAAKAGVGEATLHRWLRDPGFQAEYRAARRAVVEAAVGRVQQIAGEGVDALRRNLGCGQPAVEVRAAVAVLDLAARGVELVDLISRVEELERILYPEDGHEAGDTVGGAGRPTGGAADGRPGAGGDPAAVTHDPVLPGAVG